MDIEIIKEFVKNKHGNQMRKNGTPYYLHPYAVAKILFDYGFDLDYQVVGLFHDLLEDTDATEKELLDLSNQKIVNIVKLLTKELNYNMTDYINRINNNEIAKMVKLVDRIHNLSEAILVNESFREKYIKETIDWYIDLANNTCFEEPLKLTLKNVELSLKKN